ncbi:hypothetical protein BN1708_016558, partial [Verticillium longisporum]
RKAYSLDSSFLSAIEEDPFENLSETQDLFAAKLNLNLNRAELEFVRRLAELVGTRAARLSACGVAAICKKKNYETCHVGADGSVFNKYPHFKERGALALREILDWPEKKNPTDEDPIEILAAEDVIPRREVQTTLFGSGEIQTKKFKAPKGKKIYVPVRVEPKVEGGDDGEHNVAYMGTLVKSGYGQGIVFATGGNTHFGTIATSVSGTESPRSPLQLSMDDLGSQLSKVSFDELAEYAEQVGESEEQVLEQVPRRFEHGWDQLMKPVARLMTPH